MNDIIITGVIINSNIPELDLVFKHLFLNVKYKTKDNKEIYIESNNFDIYIYEESDHNPEYESGNFDYLFESTFTGLLNDAESLIKKISEELYDRKLKYLFEYYERSDEGKGDLREIRHPDFD